MRHLWLPLASALACAAGEETPVSASFGNSPSAATATPSATTTGADTTGATSAGGGDVTSTPDPGDTGAPGSTTTDTTGFDTNPDGLASGLECTADIECQTGDCYKIPLPLDDLPPGICSECNEDQDCRDRGLGISCTVDAATLGGRCMDGGLGSFCETQAACQPQYWCDAILPNADGLLPHACGECRDHPDCKDGKRCTPRIDLGTYTGNKYCAATAVVPNGGLCPEFSGDGVCTSGKCGVVTVVGELKVGICGACKTDADCGAPKVCTPGKFDDGFFGATCT